jgi:hypothetical protein
MFLLDPLPPRSTLLWTHLLTFTSHYPIVNINFNPVIVQ